MSTPVTARRPASRRKGGTLGLQGISEAPGGRRVYRLAAHRIVQESLTNVVRHAATPTCRVTVERRTDTLLVETAGEGRSTPPSVDLGGGYGLVGMRERVALLGGSLTAGPRRDGFQVTAQLPLEGTPTA